MCVLTFHSVSVSSRSYPPPCPHDAVHCWLTVLFLVFAIAREPLDSLSRSSTPQAHALARLPSLATRRASVARDSRRVSSDLSPSLDLGNAHGDLPLIPLDDGPFPFLAPPPPAHPPFPSCRDSPLPFSPSPPSLPTISPADHEFMLRLREFVQRIQKVSAIQRREIADQM